MKFAERQQRLKEWSNNFSFRLRSISFIFLRIFNHDLCLNSLHWYSLVLVSILTVNNFFLSTISISFMMLYVWTISCLKHLYSTDLPRPLSNNLWIIPSQKVDWDRVTFPLEIIDLKFT